MILVKLVNASVNIFGMTVILTWLGAVMPVKPVNISMKIFSMTAILT